MKIRVTRTIIYEGEQSWIENTLKYSRLGMDRKKFTTPQLSIRLVEEKREDIKEAAS